jgi:hypothetical protein
LANLHEGRRAYETNVRFLRQAADRLIFLGLPAEVVARTMFAGRTALKQYYRRDLNLDVLSLMRLVIGLATVIRSDLRLRNCTLATAVGKPSSTLPAGLVVSI